MSCRLLLITKKYHHLGQTAELLDRSRYIYPIDGLIFAPKRTSGGFSLPILKWKPACKLTLDLEINDDDGALMAKRSKSSDGELSMLNFDELGVASTLSIQEYEQAMLCKSIAQKMPVYSFHHVAEFLWNRLCHKWVFIRWRPDRTRPNTVDEVAFVLFASAQYERNIWDLMQAAHDDFNKQKDEDLEETGAVRARACPRARAGARARNYEKYTFGGYNGAIKHLLYCAVGGKQIADLGCGPAKDISRWVAAGVSSVLAVDADESSIVATETLLVQDEKLGLPCRGGVHASHSMDRLTVLLAHGDLRDPAGPLKDAVAASLQRMGCNLDAVYCNFAIQHFFDAELRFIFKHLKVGGKLIVTYMESEKIVASISTPRLRVELDAGNSDRLMVTVATIGKTHSEARVDRASLIARCREWGLVCEGFLPFGSFASILGPPSMETTLYCCAVFRKPNLDIKTVEIPSFRDATATNFPVRAALQGGLSNKVMESLQKSPLWAAVMLGYDHAGILDVLKAFPTISLSDQLSAIEKWLQMHGIYAETKSEVDFLYTLLQARGDGALTSSDISAVLKTAIELEMCSGVIELLLQSGATFESSSTAVKKLCTLPYNAIDLFCKYDLISNICDGNSKKTSLMIACAVGVESCVQSLLQHGSDPNEMDIYGSTARDYAKISDNATACQALIARVLPAQRRDPEAMFCGKFSASQMRLLSKGCNREYFVGSMGDHDDSPLDCIFTAILCAVRNSVTSKDLADTDKFETGLIMTDSGSVVSCLPWDLWELVLTVFVAVSLEEEANRQAAQRARAAEENHYYDEQRDYHDYDCYDLVPDYSERHGTDSGDNEVYDRDPGYQGLFYHDEDGFTQMY
jgi:hypothetical protein